ncbi:hypothetical protein OK016_22790 [Vibrio chagasii]|nr:hypothetical protein [Vibrio chagasii]
MQAFVERRAEKPRHWLLRTMTAASCSCAFNTMLQRLKAARQPGSYFTLDKLQEEKAFANEVDQNGATLFCCGR